VISIRGEGVLYAAGSFRTAPGHPLPEAGRLPRLERCRAWSARVRARHRGLSPISPLAVGDRPVLVHRRTRFGPTLRRAGVPYVRDRQVVRVRGRRCVIDGARVPIADDVRSYP
jgi:hypothetical protein